MTADAALADRIAVVTGATGRLGGLVTARFAEAGARIAAIGRRAEALAERVAGLPGGADRHLGLAVDLTDAAATMRAAAQVYERLGRPSILLHLAGGYRGEAGIVEAPSAELEAMLDVNVRPTWNVLRAFLPAVRDAVNGRIVTVSTPFAAAPGATGAAYAGSKAASEALTLSVAKELAGSSATANVVVVRTIGDAKPHHSRPDEIVAALLWLCSTEAGVVNGQRIPLVGRV
jgi:NAD(P)-dependent dehydrogenase (short-subunit alcohol dehydrogenase family)